MIIHNWCLPNKFTMNARETEIAMEYSVAIPTLTRVEIQLVLEYLEYRLQANVKTLCLGRWSSWCLIQEKYQKRSEFFCCCRTTIGKTRESFTTTESLGYTFITKPILMYGEWDKTLKTRLAENYWNNEYYTRHDTENYHQPPHLIWWWYWKQLTIHIGLITLPNISWPDVHW